MSTEEKKPSVKDLAKMNIPIMMPGQGPPPKKEPLVTGAPEGGIKARMSGMAIPMMMPGQGPPPKKATAPEPQPEEPQQSVEDRQKKLNKHSGRARVSVAIHRESRHKYDQLPDDAHIQQYMQLLNQDSDDETAASTSADDVSSSVINEANNAEQPTPLAGKIVPMLPPTCKKQEPQNPPKKRHHAKRSRGRKNYYKTHGSIY